MTAPASSPAAALPEPRQGEGLSAAGVAAIVALAVLARLYCWGTRPPDMSIFLEPWFAHIVHYGPIQAFAHPFSNYEPAYLYILAMGSLVHGLAEPMTIIKAISVAGTLFLTAAEAELLKSLGADRRGALLVLVLPSVVLNDALLGQCDALWAGSCILALAAMIGGETLRSLVWCGIAIAFKAQAAFIAPVIIGALIGRRAPWWQWLVPGAVFLATLLPAWLLGWPAIKLLTVYGGQASWDQIPGRLANPWMLGTIFADQASRGWFFLGYAAAAAAGIALASLAARNPRDPRLLVLLGALAGTALPFLLPKMLERYYFLGDVLALALALSFRSKEATFAAVSVQAASVLSLLTYMYFYYEPYPALGGAVCAAAALVAMCQMAWPALRANSTTDGCPRFARSIKASAARSGG